MNLDKSIEELKRKSENLENLNGKRSVSFAELFDENFISKHTRYSSISEFLTESNLGFPERWPAGINEEALDLYIKNNSDFLSWHEMKLAATKEYINKEINK